MVFLKKVDGLVMVELPSVYLHQQNLAAGSTVEIEIEGSKLVITPGKRRLTLADILAAAPKDSRTLRAKAWDELYTAGNER